MVVGRSIDDVMGEGQRARIRREIIKIAGCVALST